MTEVPQAFKDAIETEWRHDIEMNVDSLTTRLIATARIMCTHEEAVEFKNVIEENVASELYKLVSSLVVNEENTKLRKLLKRAWHLILRSTNGATSACKWHEEMVGIHAIMRELGIEVD